VICEAIRSCHSDRVIGRAARLAYLALGIVCVGLGVLGAFLPVMPTTVFLLIALWAFSKSSSRLEHWLLEHPRWGKRIREWREHRTIPLPVKLTAWSSMAASLTVMFVIDASPIAITSAAAFMLVGAIYIASRPSHPRASEPPAT
jgi:uncharacterized membrane protein YbaN (DUF454 family)